ncbi:CsbD family protein [Roseomonas sp. M0104]|uniref:CsbD family protein n=1 Tax=Teichococcus coralli TaxID=2545983 RepID=A0A845BEQ9_9PROT|nr:CsbD family protein [Pseudoroseomonas coralli]MXP64596.1 CsbD family protein [Pseudoroseomonas coralli]
MNSDRIEGSMEDFAGRAQEGMGDLTGDREQKARGVVRQIAGRAQHAYGDARDYAQHAYDDARHYAQDAGERVGRVVEHQPLTSLLVVGILGYILGLLTPRR